jgi:hypothetical protein
MPPCPLAPVKFSAEIERVCVASSSGKLANPPPNAGPEAQSQVRLQIEPQPVNPMMKDIPNASVNIPDFMRAILPDY